MAIIQSDWAKGKRSAPYPSHAGEVVSERFFVDALAAGLVVNNIYEVAPIPVDCRVVDVILDSDDIDNGGTAALLDVGIMSGVFGDPAQDRTIGAEFFSGSTVGQAGGLVRPTLKTATRVAPSQTVRSIGIKIATAPTTPQDGQIGLTVLYATA